MNRTVVTILVALFAVPAFAGCLGGDDPPKTSEGECGEKCDIDGPITKGLGGVRGTVADFDTLTPLESANVTLRLGPGDQITTKTDTSGKYAFNDIAPGTYTVFAEKFPTHKAKSKDVTIVADDVAEGDLSLIPNPPPPQPYKKDHDIGGHIGCSVAMDPIEPSDLCAAVGNENAQDRLSWFVEPRMTGLSLLLESGAAVTGQPLDFSAQFFTPSVLGGMRGPAPLGKNWDITEDLRWAQWEEPEQEFTLSVRPNSQAGSPQIAYEQGFHVWITMFYNGMPIPDGYTPKGDG